MTDNELIETYVRCRSKIFLQMNLGSRQIGIEGDARRHAVGARILRDFRDDLAKKMRATVCR